jgi:hypothetical protein
MTLAHAPPLSPKISDVELLSMICQLGRAATETSIGHAINERIGSDVSIEWKRLELLKLRAPGSRRRITSTAAVLVSGSQQLALSV